MSEDTHDYYRHGGSPDGPTCDADGNILQAGDHVVFVEHHDPMYGGYVGKRGVVTWAQDSRPFAQIHVDMELGSGLAPMSTFSRNVRKES